MLKINSVGLFAISRQISKAKLPKANIFAIARFAESRLANGGKSCEMKFTFPHCPDSFRVILDANIHFERIESNEAKV